MDWKQLLSSLYDSDELRVRFVEPATEAQLAELDRAVGGLADDLRALLMESNGVLLQQKFERGWDDSMWLVWNAADIASTTAFHRELMTEDEDEGLDPGATAFFSNGGLGSVAFGCQSNGEVWIWGPVSGEWEKKFDGLQTYFERDAAGTVYGSD